ncbi:hypothetical protein HPB47_014230 [Ixodes persulcatus]|uniref:Uncharacterized protein n=1 Tax=Ixodes persulcatus TaxID=34615 RepID=A0AC60QWQ4_IXOPE|nr:hypothetical protein HPB47_014230 [Ixodes persulcatus]
MAIPHKESRNNCCVVGCNSTCKVAYGTKYYIVSSKPYEAEYCATWVRLVRPHRDDGTASTPTANSKVCSKYFTGIEKRNAVAHPSLPLDVSISIQKDSSGMSLTGPTGDVLAASSSAAPEEILPTPTDGGIYSDDCNQAFPSKLHWDNTFTVKKEPIESPPPWSIEDHGLGAPDCMSSLQGQMEGRWRNGFLHETQGKLPLTSMFCVSQIL